MTMLVLLAAGCGGQQTPMGPSGFTMVSGRVVDFGAGVGVSGVSRVDLELQKRLGRLPADPKGFEPSGHDSDVRFRTHETAVVGGAPARDGADDRQAAVQFLGGDDGHDRTAVAYRFAASRTILRRAGVTLAAR